MNEGQNRTENNRQEGLGHIRFEGGVAETTTSDNDRSTMSSKEILRDKRKALAWKIMKDVEQGLEGEENVSKRQLTKWKISLETSQQQINELDKAILAELIEQQDETSIETEIEITNSFQTDVKMALEDVQEALMKFSVCERAESHEQRNPGIGSRGSIPTKLPKLNLRHFDGDPMKWLPFWDSFEGSIHSRKDLSERNKFDYLTGLLEGDVLKVIDNYRLDNRNYQAAISLLKERYGDTEKIGRLHYQALMDIQPVHRDNDINSIRKFYTEIETNHKALLSLGKKQEHYSDILVPQLENKLPNYLRISVLQQKPSESWSMDEMLAILLKEIKIRESKPQQAREVDKPVRRESRQVTTGSALVGNRAQRGECPFCLGHHKAESCQKITDIQERKNLLKKYMRCFSCLQRGHRIKDCQRKNSCSKCQESHHTSICGGPKKTSETTIPSLHAQTKGNIAMETLQAFVTAKMAQSQ